MNPHDTDALAATAAQDAAYDATSPRSGDEPAHQVPSDLANGANVDVEIGAKNPMKSRYYAIMDSYNTVPPAMLEASRGLATEGLVPMRFNDTRSRNCDYCNGVIPKERLRAYTVRFCSDACANNANIDQVRLRNRGTTDPQILPRSTVGALHELVAATDLMRRGYHVFRALSPSSPADLIAYKDPSSMIRVEVRTGTRRVDEKMIYPANPRDEGRYDVYAIVFHDGDVIYIPELSMDNGDE